MCRSSFKALLAEAKREEDAAREEQLKAAMKEREMREKAKLQKQQEIDMQRQQELDMQKQREKEEAEAAEAAAKRQARMGNSQMLDKAVQQYSNCGVECIGPCNTFPCVFLPNHFASRGAEGWHPGQVTPGRPSTSTIISFRSCALLCCI